MAPIDHKFLEMMLCAPLPESKVEESMLEIDAPSDPELFPEEIPKNKNFNDGDYDFYEEEEDREQEKEDEEDEDDARERIIQ